VCCTAGWDIAIGAAELARVGQALAAGELTPPGGQPCVVSGPDLPAGAAAILRRTAAGDCVFFDREGGRLCAIQRAAGHASLPSACRHFPRVLLADDDAVSVAFSHVCPTAAGMLIDGDDLAIVEERRALGPEPEAEGFDARGTVPPFVRPGVVFDRASWRAWETFLVEACNRNEAPEAVLARIASGAEALRAWTPAKGGMADFAARVFARAMEEDGIAFREATVWGDVARLCERVADCVRPGLPRPAMAEPCERGDGESAWRAGARAARRYLAARAFAAWSAYLGDGLRTQVAVLAATLAVLRAEVERAASEADTKWSEAGASWRPASAGRHLRPGASQSDVWLRAVSNADRLLVHHVDDAALCRRFANIETMSGTDFLRVLGVGGA
jgi:Fe-S-cluster containining protein